jgi:exodeoxyribonuclease VII large subunit
VNVYAPRGNYQLIVSAMEPKGESAAQIAMRKLVEQLKKEGALDPDRKRPIPLWPERVVLVTSPHSAAAADLRRVLRRRWPACDVVIAPTLVQGENAPAQIVDAFDRVAEYATRSGPVDVVICGRGGGSAEDLSAWNDERVARAILACPFPVISAVGHEIDVSVADLVADLRAATPSEAAELAVPDQWEILERVEDLQHQLLKAMRRKLADEHAAVAALAASWGLRHPVERLQHQMQRCDDLGERLSTALRGRMAQTAVQLASLAPRLHTAAAANVHDARYRTGALAGKLESLSPLKVLGRGYALVQRAEDGSVVTDPAQAPAGTPLRLRTAGGALRAVSDGAETEE